MKKNLRFWMVAVVSLVGAVSFSSCTYDPYYTSLGGSYSNGYGDGYGYGGDSFSTSVFVGTGNPRWGYDPHCYSYYDYTRRAYYDPYLNGYYPVGYRPRVVYGASHPHGWRPGSGYCRPPSRVTNVVIHDSRNRESVYRNAGYATSGRSYDPRQVRGRYDGKDHSYGQPQVSPFSRPYQEPRPSPRPSRQISGQGRYRSDANIRQAPAYPSRYNTPVTAPPQEVAGRGRIQLAPRDQSRPPQQSNLGRPQSRPGGSGEEKGNGRRQGDGEGRRRPNP